MIDSYSLTAIRGSQGDHNYYLAQCPLRLVTRLFLFDEPELPSELRRTRSLTVKRVRGLARYLAARPTSYVLAPLVAAIDCEVNFEPLENDLQEIGLLHIPLTARVVIHDGQHRRAAIEQVLDENPTLGNDTIPIMLFPDPQLSRSTQLYADLNHHTTQRNQSQRVLHDQDSPLA